MLLQVVADPVMKVGQFGKGEIVVVAVNGAPAAWVDHFQNVPCLRYRYTVTPAT